MKNYKDYKKEYEDYQKKITFWNRVVLMITALLFAIALGYTVAILIR